MEGGWRVGGWQRCSNSHPSSSIIQVVMDEGKELEMSVESICNSIKGCGDRVETEWQHGVRSVSLISLLEGGDPVGAQVS